MTISEHAEVFYGREVKPFDGPDDWVGPDLAYRVAITWDDKMKVLHERLDQLARCEGAEDLEALIIGAWNGDDSAHPSSDVVQTLVGLRSRLPSLKALFVGDITFEENEISWIEQSDVAPLLEAFPSLTVFRVRGGNRLQLTPLRHDSLTHLIVETGGLPRSVIREICQCEFPNLQHLELWLGTENYGFDGGVEDLQPLLTGKLFPRLVYLGLRNSEIADDIAPVVVNAPILQRLRVLDLSNGNLSDTGAQALLQLPPGLPLEVLNLTHHYMTPDMVERLRKTLKYGVIAADGQDPGEEWRGVVVSE
jgi:hypothetical protein